LLSSCYSDLHKNNRYLNSAHTSFLAFLFKFHFIYLVMETNEKRISSLYYDYVNVDEAIELLRDRNISAKLIKSVYNRLSNNATKLTTDQFYYYTIKDSVMNNCLDMFKYWTSRYLLVYSFRLSYSDSHKIKIIDLFNDKST
jgi:hypothetical protein